MPEIRQDDVGGRAGEGHEHRVVAGMAQAVDKRPETGLAQPKGGPAGQHEDQWHDDRAERIDVLEAD